MRALRCEAGTLHLPQLFSANMAVCRAPAPPMDETFPRFKGSPAPFFFFHLSAPAHGQNHRLIFQNMFLACAPTTAAQPPPPLLSLSSLPPLPPRLPPLHHLPLSHTAHSLFTTYFPLFIHHPPKPNLPAEMYDFFFSPYLFFSASVLPSIQSLAQYVLWINKK